MNSEIQKIVKCIVIAVIGCLLIYGAVSAVIYWFNKDNNVEIVETQGVNEEIVNNILDKYEFNPKTTTNEVMKEVNQIRSGTSTTKPIAVFETGTSTQEIQKAVNKDKGDFTLSEPAPEGVTGTYLYSVHIDKYKYGVGVFVATKPDSSIKDETIVGIHYRNKRWIYQVGVDRDMRVETRVAYEVFQW